MPNLCQTLLNHLQKYPKMQGIDVAKLLHQGLYGPGHLLADSEKAYALLQAEWPTAQGQGTPYTEDIGGGFCRLYLHAVQEGFLSATTVFSLFALSAAAPLGDNEALMTAAKKAQSCLVQHGHAPLAKALQKAVQNNTPPFGHSNVYKQAYHPAYRVIKHKYANFLPLFSAIDKLLAENPAPILAIDGKCASGKTTLAQLLEKVYPCHLIHMDDFFLQAHQRSEERLAEIGGHVDYERFCNEVLCKLHGETDFFYRPYRCISQDFSGSVPVNNRKMRVVEGSYAMHPQFGDYATLAVFMSASETQQLVRIAKRNGPAAVEIFKTIYIPKENIYFKTFHVRQRCHFCFDTTF